MWNEAVEQAKCGFCIHTIDSSGALFKFQPCLCGEVWKHTRPEFIQGSSNPCRKLWLLILTAPWVLIAVSPLKEEGLLKHVCAKKRKEQMACCYNVKALVCDWVKNDFDELKIKHFAEVWTWTYFLVFSFFSRAFACCSLMMVALTCGGFMCTFNFPPTRRRTVAANLVWVFNTCGGCFSMMKVLWRQNESSTQWQNKDLVVAQLIKIKKCNNT